MSGKTAHQIDAEAADWAARIDREPLSPEQELSFQAWLSADPRALGAYGRMRAVALETLRARALGTDFNPADFGHAPPSRRMLLQAGTAIAATLLVGSLGAWEVVRTRGRYRTQKGETKVVALKDGSVVTLNTDTEIQVAFTDGERAVELVKGEALFDVAKNKTRPFVVAAGDTSVRVVGTSFTVSRLEEAPVQVLVREGIVEVFKPLMVDARPVRITAGTRAVAAVAQTQDQAAVAVSAVPTAQLHREMAWQDGHIAFEGQTLEQAAAEFSRYSDIRIVVDDPVLAHEEIAGLFRANDPVGFAHTVAVSLNVHVNVGEGEVRLSR
jgi:transmembrane sensor